MSEVMLRRAALAYAAVAHLDTSDPRWRRCWRARRLAATGMVATMASARNAPQRAARARSRLHSGGPARPAPNPEAEAVAERIRGLKKAGVRGNLDQLEKRIAKARDEGPLGELEAIERWLRRGIKGEDIEVLEESTVQGRKNPDCRVKGELTEIKTRVQPLNHRYVSDVVRDASVQIRDSGLDAGRPMVGAGRLGPQGQVEIQLNGEAARTSTLDVIEAQVRRSFNPKDGASLRRVAVYCEGRLVGEWVRTAANVIVRTLPL